MKGKIAIVLLGLALVFGMVAASCDNGTYPKLDPNDKTTQAVYEGRVSKGATSGLPKFDAAGKPVLLSGDEIIKALESYSNKPIPGGDQNNRVKTYILDVVKAPAPSDPDAEKKMLYQNMPLLIDNPALATP